MYFKEMELSNFRNYENQKIYFHKNVNIIVGNNAQGKTNILEAVYVSGTTRSHKSAKDRELIYFGEEEAHICTIMERNGLDHKIDLHLRKNKKKDSVTCH